MVISIIYDAIQIKTTRFEKAATLINLNEVAAALRLAYAQAGMEAPPLAEGTTVEAARSQLLEQTNQGAGINEKLIAALMDYPYEQNCFDEEARQVYEVGPSN